MERNSDSYRSPVIDVEDLDAVEAARIKEEARIAALREEEEQARARDKRFNSNRFGVAVIVIVILVVLLCWGTYRHKTDMDTANKAVSEAQAASAANAAALARIDDLFHGRAEKYPTLSDDEVTNLSWDMNPEGVRRGFYVKDPGTNAKVAYTWTYNTAGAPAATKLYALKNGTYVDKGPLSIIIDSDESIGPISEEVWALLDKK